MPTVYTWDVANGKITEIGPFLLQLSRGMGFLIAMRDDPSDAPIPEVFEPSSHHIERLAEERRKLQDLLRMLPDEIQQAATADYEAERAAWRKRAAERSETEKRYRKLAAILDSWDPTHEAMIGLRRFGLEQLNSSLTADCSDRYDVEPQQITADEWHAQQIKAASWSINYHTEEHAKEVRRAAERTECVAELRRAIALLDRAASPTKEA